MPVKLPIFDSDDRLKDFAEGYEHYPFEYELYVVRREPRGEWTKINEDCNLEHLEEQGELMLMRSEVVGWLVKNYRQEIISDMNAKRSGLPAGTWL